MEYVEHVVILVVDSFIFGFCYIQYIKNRNLSNKFKDVLNEGINPAQNKNLAVVQGSVKALKQPIRSINSYTATGVIQKLTVKERAITRTPHGFWLVSERSNILDEKWNTVPFVLKNKRYSVKINDPLSAEHLVLDVVQDRFEPSLSNFLERLFGYFIGIHHEGIQYTEYLLKEDTLLTGFGQIIYQNGELQLLPPSDGSPYILTTLHPTLFLHQLDQKVRFYRWPLVISACIGLFTTGLIFKKWWNNRKAAQLRNELRLQIRNRRLAARDRQNSQPASSDQYAPPVCIVCYEKNREIVFVPCGHICVCYDCSEQIGNLCPMCREIIRLKNFVFMS